MIQSCIFWEIFNPTFYGCTHVILKMIAKSAFQKSAHLVFALATVSNHPVAPVAVASIV